MKKESEKEEIKFKHLEYLIILLIKIIGPVILLTAGLVLMAFRVAGWSIILGLPMIIIGVVFLIYAYDEILSNKKKHNHDTMKIKGITVEEE